MKMGYYTDLTDIKKIVSYNCEMLSTNTFDNLDEIDLFLKEKPTEIPQKEIDNTNNLIKEFNLY